MLPKNKLAFKTLDKLKIYNGSEHPHQAQEPELTELGNQGLETDYGSRQEQRYSGHGPAQDVGRRGFASPRRRARFASTAGNWMTISSTSGSETP